MTVFDHLAAARDYLSDADISVLDINERSFPGERWLIIFVSPSSLVVAQSLAGSLEELLNAGSASDSPFAVTFRSQATRQEVEGQEATPARGRLFNSQVDQLIQLLEARSRTSDALPSLKYVEDPRVGPLAIGASRHQLIYGRRGVGKTALMLEAKRVVGGQGFLTVWLNAQVVRKLDAPTASAYILELILSSLVQNAGTSRSHAFQQLSSEAEVVSGLRAPGIVSADQLDGRIPTINQVLRGVLRPDITRLYVFLDDFYLIPIEQQAQVLDYLSGALRDCDGWLKIASIERLTRPFEPSSKIGLELPHDATKVDIDITLEDPGAAQAFLESLMASYTATAGVKGPSFVAKNEALGRLVLASGAVPRDYLNLFASSIVVAREKRKGAQEIGKEDVAVAAGRSARSKKRDLELDVSSELAPALLAATESLSELVRKQGFAYFLIDVTQKNHANYSLLAQIVDLRFAHLVSSVISDQHKGGVRYEAYILDLSEYSDVRLRRGLNILDLEDGSWIYRLTGKARTEQKLSGTQLRDRLRQAPVIDLEDLQH